ncbi:MAG: AAA family ATPase [Alphaproteobacteria bacterium]|nr:AAA family ATPase [Alphaproteobacteria bacterium]MCB9691656.1 AAA family ATPase [Alphaproteobacteria bacterium]
MRKIGHSAGAANCLLVGLDNEAMGMVREALAAEAQLPNSPIGFGDVEEAIEEERPQVIIVGYSNAIDASIELASTIAKSHPNIALIALADRADSQAILAAMRVGFKEFVVLPQEADRLREVVKSAASMAEDDEDKGTVIAMIGAKGGVGTTVLTTNLCTELAAIHTVLCADFDFGMGDVASLLDLKIRDTIADLAQRADRLDERSLTASVAVHKSKVHVLPVPENINMIGEATGEELYSILNLAAKAYHYVFVDCGTHLDEAVTLACQAADTIVLITTPDITSVRDALRKIRMLQAADVPKERIRLVVNRWYKGAFVSLEDIKENLGIPVSATVADDPRTVEQAVNEGKLIRDANKKSDTARDISNLVAVLTEDAVGGHDPDDDGGGKKRGWWPFG